MKYCFFVAWLRAREKRIADQIDFDRMINSSTIEESFKVLNDTDYALFLNENNIEEILEKGWLDFKKTLELMGLDKEIIGVLIPEDSFSFMKKEFLEKVCFICRKEKSALEFFKKYLEIINQEDSFKKDQEIIELENEIIEKGEYLTNGFLPLIAFIIKKKRADYFLSTIFNAKKINMDSLQIRELMEIKRAL